MIKRRKKTVSESSGKGSIRLSENDAKAWRETLKESDRRAKKDKKIVFH
jgi:hypothetical protein